MATQDISGPRFVWTPPRSRSLWQNRRCGHCSARGTRRVTETCSSGYTAVWSQFFSASGAGTDHCGTWSSRRTGTNRTSCGFCSPDGGGSSGTAYCWSVKSRSVSSQSMESWGRRGWTTRTVESFDEGIRQESVKRGAGSCRISWTGTSGRSSRSSRSDCRRNTSSGRDRSAGSSTVCRSFKTSTVGAEGESSQKAGRGSGDGGVTSARSSCTGETSVSGTSVVPATTGGGAGAESSCGSSEGARHSRGRTAVAGTSRSFRVTSAGGCGWTTSGSGPGSGCAGAPRGTSSAPASTARSDSTSASTSSCRSSSGTTATRTSGSSSSSSVSPLSSGSTVAGRRSSAGGTRSTRWGRRRRWSTNGRAPRTHGCTRGWTRRAVWSRCRR